MPRGRPTVSNGGMPPAMGGLANNTPAFGRVGKNPLPGAVPPLLQGTRSGETIPALTPANLEALARHMARMLRANVTAERAVVILAQNPDDKPLAAIGSHLLNGVRSGQSLSAVFADILSPEDRFYSVLVHSGEAVGDLASAFEQVERLIVKRNELTKRVSASLVYPLVLSVVGMVSLMLILLFVIPQFQGLLEISNTTLPWAAEMVFGLSSTVQSLQLPLAVMAGLLVYLAIRTIRKGNLHLLLLRLFSIMPGMKEVPSFAEISNFARLLGVLSGNQVKLVQALSIASQTMNDRKLRAGAEDALSQIKQGTSLTKALSASGLFPLSLVQMVQIGEETGELGPMLVRAADLLDNDLDARVKRFLILFEPMVLLFLGLFVGILLYGLFSAILSVNDIAF